MSFSLKFLFFVNMSCFSYTSHPGFVLFCFVCLFLIWGVSLTHPMLASFLSVQFLLHISCWFYFCLRSFCNTSRAGLIFMQVVSLTHLMLASFLSGEFLLQNLKQALCFCGEFLLHIPCWLLFLICGVSLTHPVLAAFLSGEFL